jgi:hypothetical protein
MRIFLLFLTPMAIALLGAFTSIYSFILVLILVALIPLSVVKSNFLFQKFEFQHRFLLVMAFQFLVLSVTVFVLDMKDQNTIILISSFLILAETLVAWFWAAQEKVKDKKAIKYKLTRHLYFAFNFIGSFYSSEPLALVCQGKIELIYL